MAKPHWELNNCFVCTAVFLSLLFSQSLTCFQPSNIFVSNDLQQVQVGDFGLACSLLTHNPEVAILPSMHAHRGQVGTKSYAAPEQLNSICTAKVIT